MAKILLNRYCCWQALLLVFVVVCCFASIGLWGWQWFHYRQEQTKLHVQKQSLVLLKKQYQQLQHQQQSEANVLSHQGQAVNITAWLARSIHDAHLSLDKLVDLGEIEGLRGHQFHLVLHGDFVSWWSWYQSWRQGVMPQCDWHHWQLQAETTGQLKFDAKLNFYQENLSVAKSVAVPVPDDPFAIQTPGLLLKDAVWLGMAQVRGQDAGWVRMHDGPIESVQIGSILVGKWSVVAIQPHGVTLRNDKQEVYQWPQD